mmetsp:Transcript_42071/g.37285  ORF Transcript_42071/g.37285 Transcript_42071/m.37285 type:complete len:153 (+) Transcript_42071:107-565(+)|eukprot:CAMPEP_0201566072 /NCGR_PEP_ID=MMETSP0190_2-20130828/5618_1 /ASSEMBLY_ACC=CAM_ASM_000263 /TAXON_ID=37353 /ORGANISM="Rosalina sp." /LENGTH=152 /DNA_ID=CAMNT_0047984311 /DNA_START=105 /DNA_END=563 /DNA_ORIENTATION=+
MASQSAQPITKTYDPFPRVTEYEQNKLPAEAPKTPPKQAVKKDEKDILSQPIIAEFNEDALAMPKESDKANDTTVYAQEATDKAVLVEWQPPKEKAVHEKAKDDKVFVKWSKADGNKQNEDLQNLEKDYLDTQKLEKEKNEETNDNEQNEDK